MAGEKTPKKGLVIIYRALLGIAALLALVLALGSLYALFRGPVREPPQGASQGTGKREEVFSGMAQIRAVTAGPAPATVILSIAFPWPPEDRDFSGELFARTEDFRESAASWISSLSAARLRQIGEDAVKAELLSRFNSLLRLGRLERLYFEEYMIME